MNELQKKEFELLKIFVDICEKLDLKYYLVCGSALGAVKYGGFIPWDDDVDVAMPRKDYETFLDRAPEFLPPYFFIQNYRTDPEFPKVFTKLRDSRTTYIEFDYRNLNINHGVFIDIFSLDGYPVDGFERWLFEFRKKWYMRLTSCSLDSEASARSNKFRRLLRCLGFHKRTASLLNSYENMIINHSHDEECTVFCNYGNFRGEMRKTPKNVYGDGTPAVFEGLDVYVPDDSHTYLSDLYGDYNLDLPEDEKKGHHGYAVLDLEIPYTEYR